MDMCVYLSSIGVSREACESKWLRCNGGSEGSCSGAPEERLLWFKTGLLSNRPNRRQRFRGVGRFTVNAQEKE